MRWHIKHQLTSQNKSDRLTEILTAILKHRGLTTKTQITNFINPKPPQNLTLKQVGISPTDFTKAFKRLLLAHQKSESIVVYGDYDADGITATAIMWETLHTLGFKVAPFIPHREIHGYGLSIPGLKEIIKKHQPKLIITVDNGIVAFEAATFLETEQIDLIITDHHVASEKLPSALAILHTTQLAGAGVSWMVAKEIITKFSSQKTRLKPEQTLDLATIGTVADQVPLLDYNRCLVTHGLKVLQTTKRTGLTSLFTEAAIDPQDISTYHINFIIAPRLNAMGRLDHALDSLRLLCTTDAARARKLARLLGNTNQQRQQLTETLLQKGLELVDDPKAKILIIDHQEFHEGVVGLVAGKLAETYYRPSIVISRGENQSKASARSISGVNIIDLIRQKQALLVNAGGHPMAAGFTIESQNIDQFKTELLALAEDVIDNKFLQPVINIDCQINPSDITWKLFQKITRMEPFGMGNPRPTFALHHIKPLDILTIGQEGKHLKLILPSTIKTQPTIEALWFSHGADQDKLTDDLSLAFTLDQNTWNGHTKLQLLIKDIEK